jgi:hypothetical protein
MHLQCQLGICKPVEAGKVPAKTMLCRHASAMLSAVLMGQTCLTPKQLLLWWLLLSISFFDQPTSSDQVADY